MPPLNPQTVAQLGALKLASLVDKTGEFTYRYSHADKKQLVGYNPLRHAGTIWAMLDVYRTTKDEEVLDASKRAVTYLLNNYLRFYRDPNNLCICDGKAIKLGGSGLATLALLSLYEITGDEFLLIIARKLCDFVIKEREQEGSFVHKRYFGSGKISEFESSYYVGEALFGLLKCYDVTKDAKYLQAVLNDLSDLEYYNYGVEEQSHWMLYTLAELHKHTNVRLAYKLAVKIAKHIIKHTGYIDEGRSTPTACRSEGLLAFVNMKHPKGAVDPLRLAALVRVKQNMTEQMKFMRSDGAFIRGGECERADEVRIDYIQHNISSFIELSRL